MPVPSKVDLNNMLTSGEQLTYYPNNNTPEIHLTTHKKGTQMIMIPNDNADIQIKTLPDLAKYAWNLDPRHKNPDGTLSKYKGSMNMKKLKFRDGTTLDARVNPVSFS
jgi:hypothetical protein